MDRFRLNSLFTGIVLVVAVCVGFAMVLGCATAPKKAEGPVATLKVCPSAEITTLKYSMKKSKFIGGLKFHMKVGIKNISDKEKRYRVSIFLPEGVSSGGFYPRKGKPPILKPGAEKVREFPMFFDRVPDSLTVKVEEL